MRLDSRSLVKALARAVPADTRDARSRAALAAVAAARVRVPGACREPAAPADAEPVRRTGT